MLITNDLLYVTTGWEGRTTWPYLDTTGHVTIGVGHMVPDAIAFAALPWATGTNDRHLAYEALMKSPKGRSAHWYVSVTDLRMSYASIVDILRRDVENIAHQLPVQIPWFPKLPQPGQDALLDIAFNCGVHGLLRDFHDMLKALEAGNYTEASALCLRPEVGWSRNEWTQNKIRACASQVLPSNS